MRRLELTASACFPADDHFTLYPVFAFHSLDLLGWELAPVVLRQVVRYLATVPPVARDLVDKEGFSLIAKQVRAPATTTRITSISPPPNPATRPLRRSVAVA